MKINFGGGDTEFKGFRNVDTSDSADIICNLNNYPYPFKSDSVEHILAFHIVEHLEKPMEFFKECYRIMKKGAIMEIRVPHCEAIGSSYGTFEHLHHFHEFAIRDITGVYKSSTFPYKFKLINTEVKRGRFMFWQKREIIWWVEK